MDTKIWLYFTIFFILYFSEIESVETDVNVESGSYGRHKRSLDFFLPSDIEEIVKFKLRTRENPGEPEFLTPTNSSSSQLLTKRLSLPIKIITHGFLERGTDKLWIEMAEKFLETDDVNVITVDWGTLARFPVYFSVARRVESVADYLSKLIRALIDQGVDPQQIHIVGFSLGAHLAGYTADFLKPIKLARITALDAAMTSFKNSQENRSLKKTDAHFVDVVHTNGGVFGYLEPLGVADFYVNGGRNQPACSMFDIGTCAHVMAVNYFIESIDPRNRFPSELCRGIPEVGVGRSSKNRCHQTNYTMGLYLDPSARGIFLTETRDKAPYAPLHLEEDKE